MLQNASSQQHSASAALLQYLAAHRDIIVPPAPRTTSLEAPSLLTSPELPLLPRSRTPRVARPPSMMPLAEVQRNQRPLVQQLQRYDALLAECAAECFDLPATPATTDAALAPEPSTKPATDPLPPSSQRPPTQPDGDEASTSSGSLSGSAARSLATTRDKLAAARARSRLPR